MAIQFSCSRCGSRIEVDDEHAGGQCTCPWCQATVAVPEGTTPEAGMAQPTEVQPPATPYPRMTPPTQAQVLPPVEPGRKGWAVAALVLGILAFCLPPVGLAAIVCGIVALVLIGNRPGEYGGKGLAIAGIATGGVGLAMLVFWALIMSIMLPSLTRARELAKRSVCNANLKGIGMGMYTYANENLNDWPIPVVPRGEQAGSAGVDYTAAIGSYRGTAGDPAAGDDTRLTAAPVKLSTARVGWTLVRLRMSSPKSFVCPSSNDVDNMEGAAADYWDFGAGDITAPATAGQATQGWRQVSYGFQVPYGRRGRPSIDRDVRMPLSADKGPFGAALDAGLADPPAIGADQNTGPDGWRAWNSPNHVGQGDGEGQNVLYADCHAAWESKPIAGIENDNIYTRWSGQGAGVLDRVRGNRPTAGGKEAPADDTDTLIYP